MLARCMAINQQLHNYELEVSASSELTGEDLELKGGGYFHC